LDAGKLAPRQSRTTDGCGKIGSREVAIARLRRQGRTDRASGGGLVWFWIVRMPDKLYAQGWSVRKNAVELGWAATAIALSGDATCSQSRPSMCPVTDGD